MRPPRLPRIAAALALAAAALAQQPKAPRHDLAAWLPIDEGTRWLWQETTVDAKTGAPSGARVMAQDVFGSYRTADGTVRVLVGRREGAGVLFEHWQLAADGLRVLTSGTSLEPGPREPHGPVLAAPVGAATEWRWQEESSALTVHYRAQLTATAEPVVVPAGVFTALRIEIDAQPADEDADRAPASATSREIVHLVRGVGVVRRELASDGRIKRRELQWWQRGADGRAAREALVEVLAPPDWLWPGGRKAPLEWLDTGSYSVAFGGRFALVGDGAARRLLFAAPSEVLLLPTTAGDWRKIVATNPAWRPVELARFAADLEARRRRLVGVRCEDGEQDAVHLFGTDRADAVSLQVTARRAHRTTIAIEPLPDPKAPR